MNRRNFMKAAGAAAVLGVGGWLKAVEAARKPNFLFILVDDLGWTDLGCFNSSFYETPNLDRLCGQSMKFTDAYAACPVCSPTRASIMAGKYPARMDTTDWFGAPQPDNVGEDKRHRDKPLLPARYLDRMPLEEVTVAEALKEADYTTFFAGKWHLGETAEFWPEQQGFDTNKGGWKDGAPKGRGKYFTPYDNPRLADGEEGEYLPERLAEETVKFIKGHKGSPFLAYLSFYSVHTPLMTRKELQKKYEQKREKLALEAKFGKEGAEDIRQVQELPVYAGMVEAMDTACGRVLDALRESGHENDTIVFFMSDNGGLATTRNKPTSNLPLRAGKGWLYEGGIREPMMVKWPGVVKAGSVCDVPVTSTDFYPTMLEMAGLKSRPEQHKDGISWLPLLKGKKMDRGPLFWHYPHYGNQGGSPGSAIRRGDWKLIVWYEDNRRELFNLKNDIGEQHNVIDKHPELADELYAMLHKWLKDVDGKMPTANPNAKKR